MRPGLTGIAQIYAPRDVTRRHKFKYDRIYVRRQSFGLDVRLILAVVLGDVSRQLGTSGSQGLTPTPITAATGIAPASQSHGAYAAPHRWIDYVLPAAAMATVVWGALAFGSVYRWAYTPLAIACAVIGIVAIVAERRSGPRLGALSAALAAIGLASALQIVPLSEATFSRVSPAGDAFLRNYDFSYLLAGAPASPETVPSNSGPARTHPVSIAPEKTIVGLALFAALALFLLGLVRLVSARGALVIVRPLVIFGVVLALFGIAQAGLLADGKDRVVRKIYGFWEPRYGGSPFGPFVNRNHFAGWMLMVLPLSVAAACAAWERSTLARAGVRKGLPWLSSRSAAGTLLTTFAAVIIGLTLLTTQSRSGMAAFTAAAVIFGVVLVLRPSMALRTRMVMAGLIISLFAGVAMWAGVDRLAQRLSVPGAADNLGGRIQAWRDTVRIIRDFSWTGAGLNTYGTAMMVYQTGERHLHFREAHNEYLQIAAEGGVLVGVPIALALGIFIRDVRRRFREAPKEGTSYWLRVGAVIGLLSIALQSIVEFSLQMPGNAALFAVLAAIALHQSPNLHSSLRVRR